MHPCQSDAMIVLDASGSMGTTDFVAMVPRISRVKSALHKVLPEIAPLRKLGLIVYGQGAYDKCNAIELKLRPTSNAAETILAEADAIVPRGRTPLTESVDQAASVLDYKNKPGVVVLLTDGEETCGGDPCKTAVRLKKEAKDITIHVIGYRVKEGTGLAGYFAARCMAENTGGLYIATETEAQLVEALNRTLGCPFIGMNDHHPYGGDSGVSKLALRCHRR